MEVFVRRRICLVGAAMALASLVAGVGLAAAAGGTKPVKPTVLRCSMSMSTQPPAGSNSVDQPASQGVQYGPSHCPKKGFGPGIIADSFTVPDSGDTVGTYVQYFHAGTIAGKFDLTPNEGAPVSDTTFQSQSWTGTIKVTGGTGVYTGIKSVKGKKGVGVLNCTSPDSVHLTCTEKAKVTLPATFVP
jgi:hypothetical protein